METFPATWHIDPDSPLAEVVREVQVRLVEWGCGPGGAEPVTVWDGSQFSALGTAPRSGGPLILIGAGPFAFHDQPSALHLLTPDAPTLWAAVVALSRGLLVSYADSGRAGSGTDRPGHSGPQVSLTVREQQVLELIARGLPNKAIAADLGIGFGTVKFHLSNLMAKLGAQNRAELVMEAAREGLLEV